MNGFNYLISIFTEFMPYLLKSSSRAGNLALVVMTYFFLSGMLWPGTAIALSIGDRVSPTTNLRVRKCFSDNDACSVLTVVEKNDVGIITRGPITKGRYTWWNIRWNNGYSGYSVQNYLSLVNESPSSSLVTSSFPEPRQAEFALAIKEYVTLFRLSAPESQDAYTLGILGVFCVGLISSVSIILITVFSIEMQNNSEESRPIFQLVDVLFPPIIPSLLVGGISPENLPMGEVLYYQLVLIPLITALTRKTFYMVFLAPRERQRELEWEKQYQERQRQQAEESRIKRFEQAEESRIKKFDSLSNDRKILSDMIKKTTKEIEYADGSLTSAMSHFTNNAFSPFWDNIEASAKHLAHYKSGMDILRDGMSQYQIQCAQYKNEYKQASPLPLADQQIDAILFSQVTSNHLSIQLKKMVYSAQTNIDFSVIFEHRKTNKLLESGFKNLSDLLDKISSTIELSTLEMIETLDSMSLNISDLISDSNISSKARHEEIIDIEGESN
ncbi:MAG: hypothetical protein P8X89_23555 [Reinekea sp.]